MRFIEYDECIDPKEADDTWKRRAYQMMGSPILDDAPRCSPRCGPRGPSVRRRAL